ncbi:MAG: maleylacetoacetate isomerase [Ectothiorhodospiraceae bacterium]|nr:maleylacetoacetate isomerase [Ectothiorhodospiraceae bacterium]
MKLHGYFRSSAAYRVRIALNLKGVAYQNLPVNLVRGEQREAAYAALNPQQLVPTLETPEGHRLTQSLAICEYLDESHPQPPLLPSDPIGRARVRAIAAVVACDTHPLNNLRVLQYLTDTLGVDEESKLRWYRHWVTEELRAVEALLQDSATGRYCHGEKPSLADLCLVPQVFNAVRFSCDLAPFPTVHRIVDACNALPAFAEAAPERQPDAVQ